MTCTAETPMGFMADMGAVPPVTLTAWNLSHSCVVLILCFKYFWYTDKRGIRTTIGTPAVPASNFGSLFQNTAPRQTPFDGPTSVLTPQTRAPSCPPAPSRRNNFAKPSHRANIRKVVRPIAALANAAFRGCICCNFSAKKVITCAVCYAPET